MTKGTTMNRVQFRFDRGKAIEAILYLAQNVNEADVYGVCKLLYLVDKTSLERYGRYIFGESYFAMQEGAAPSKAYDLLKEAALESVDGIRVEGVRVVALRKPNLGELSKSDIECLDQIVASYGKQPNWKRAQDAHDDAWREAWGKRGKKRSVEMPVETVAKTLSNPDDLISHLRKSDG
jgi:uncharacterized phage-associated protein